MRKPEYNHRISKNTKITVWNNGPKGINVNISKQYKKGEQWVETKNFFPNEVPPLIAGMEHILHYLKQKYPNEFIDQRKKDEPEFNPDAW